MVLKLYNPFLYMRVINNYWCGINFLGSRAILIYRIEVSGLW
jgi:hypothetical protein